MTAPRAALAAAIALAAPALAHAAADAAELKRGFAAAGLKASVEPALREERAAAREPGTAFVTGAALGAWINAAEQLDFDLKTPSGDGDDAEAIAADCADERAAFDRLEAGARALGLAPAEAVRLVAPATLPAAAWTARQSGPPPRCR